MPLGRAERDRQSGGDLGVARALGHQPQDVELAGGERLEQLPVGVLPERWPAGGRGVRSGRPAGSRRRRSARRRTRARPCGRAAGDGRRCPRRRRSAGRSRRVPRAGPPPRALAAPPRVGRSPRRRRPPGRRSRSGRRPRRRPPGPLSSGPAGPAASSGLPWARRTRAIVTSIERRRSSSSGELRRRVRRRPIRPARRGGDIALPQQDAGLDLAGEPGQRHPGRPRSR